MKNKKSFAKVKQEVLDFYQYLETSGQPDTLISYYGMEPERADELFDPFLKGMLRGERMSDIPLEMIKISEDMGEFLFLMNQAYKLTVTKEEEEEETPLKKAVFEKDK